MKKVLLVDDNHTEHTRYVAETINSLGGFELIKCSYVKEALKEVKNSHFDFLIIDIQLPTMLDDDTDKKGGMKLIEMIEEQSNKMQMPNYIIGITSHSESYDLAIDFFKERGFPLMLSTEIISDLKPLLLNQIKYIPTKHECDIAIITALHKTEFDKILDLPINLRELETVGSHTYYTGSFVDSEGTKRSIIATYCTRMGSPSAASSASYLISRYKPKLIAMTGITGGINDELSLGDIVVADSCWNWESGKRTREDGESIFKTAADQIRLDERICALFKRYSVNRNYVEDIQNNWSGNSSSSRLSLHVGPMVSGSSVMEDEKIVSEILKQHRKILAIEMEAYGVALSANIAPSPTKFLILKSVSDLANTDKNDHSQDYAAYTSAQMLYHFLTNGYADTIS